MALDTTTDAYASDEKCWDAVRARDAGADGRFWYSVRTTGVYCRPSCGARLPRRENVAFHASRAAAEQAGFRPCKRCRPDAPDRMAGKVAAACRTIAAALEAGERSPALADLAAEAGLSPFHFHRVFTAAMGLTPGRYAAGLRAGRARAALPGAARVTDAIYDAGYGSNGRFYEASGAALGMRPSAYRDGGRGETIRFATSPCALGLVLVAATERGVCAIQFGDDAQSLREDLAARFPRAVLEAGDDGFATTVGRVVGLIEQPARGLDLPLDLRGTAFQQRVWAALRRIPAGGTASYAEVAEAIGAPRAVRAVARACSANPAAVAVPCHRVIRGDGAVSGYRWGVARKRALLARERAATAS